MGLSNDEAVPTSRRSVYEQDVKMFLKLMKLNSVAV